MGTAELKMYEIFMLQIEHCPDGDDPSDGVLDQAIGTVLAFSAEDALREAARARGFRSVQEWQDTINYDQHYFRCIEVLRRVSGKETESASSAPLSD